MSNDYLVAATRRWNHEAFERHHQRLPGRWHLVSSMEELTAALSRITPRYIFFPHWSWMVPPEIVSGYECVCFHMSDVPYGRGGSPLQNLIARGHHHTKLTALRMTDEVDAGPVYGKLDLSLEGNAQSIFERVADLLYVLIDEIVERQPIPEPQTGEVCWFKRRKPSQSELPRSGGLPALYDHIRMLDAEEYPRAFIEWGEVRLEFDQADFDGDQLIARVRFFVGEE